MVENLKLVLTYRATYRCSNGIFKRTVTVGYYGGQISMYIKCDQFIMDFKRILYTRTLTLEPHTACRKGGWGLAKIN